MNDNPSGGIVLGSDQLSNPVVLDDADRSRHMYIIGASGTGKSYFLQNIIQQDIARGRGGVLIDPHGELYDNVLRFCAQKPALAKRVVLFNPSQQHDYVFGFNPLARQAYLPDVTVQAEKLIDAIKRVMHQDIAVQPQLESTLRNALIPIIEGGHSLLELEHFFNIADTRRLLEISEQSSYSTARIFWRNFAAMQAREKLATVGSVQRRLEKFMFTDAVKLSIGQQFRTLDIANIVENRKILLVNLGLAGNRIAGETAHMLGIMLVNAFMDYGRSRDIGRAKERPFYLYLDECQHFITSDIAELLTGGRKFGMNLVLANQELIQIADEVVQQAVQAARIQVVFGGLSPKSAEIMEQVLGTHHDLLSVKYEHERTVYRPVLQKRTVQNRNWSESEGQSDGSSTTKSEGWNRPTGLDAAEPTMTESMGTGTNSSRTFQRGNGGAEGETWVTDHVPEIERTPTFWNLEEQRYRFASALRKQPSRSAVIQVGREARPVLFRTAEVEPAAIHPERLAAFVCEVQLSHGCYLPTTIAARRIEARQTPTGTGEGNRPPPAKGKGTRTVGKPVQAHPLRDTEDPFATDG
jgi:hypothetical protein